MNHASFHKVLNMLDTDILCQYKDMIAPSDMNAAESTMPLDHTMTFHNHDGYEIYLMLEGDTNFYMEGASKKAEAGDLYLIQPYAFHHGQLLNYDRYNRIVINIRIPVMEELSAQGTDLAAAFYRLPANAINLIRLNEEEKRNFIFHARKVQEALESDAFGSKILAKAYLQILLVELNRWIRPEPEPEYPGILPGLVSRTFSYLDAHLTEDGLSVETLAKALHHNSAYLSRCFKKVTGTSLQQYIIAKKTALAQKYLREGRSLSEACYDSGFHCYSNFSRTFTKQVGMTPKQYQLQARGF